MKSSACAVLTIILAAAMVQAAKKPKPKFCLANNIQYEPGQGYTEGCTKFTCVKKRKKIKWTSKPVPGCVVEPEPGLAAKVTAIEAGMKLFDGRTQNMESKMEALQTSMESILGMITAMQSTSSKLEVNITSNMDAISSNKEAISSNKETCLAIETTAAKLETCLGDVDSTDCPPSENGKLSVVDAIEGNMEDIEALEKPEVNLVLTAGYNSDETKATSVIIGTGGVCSQSIPALPVPVYGARSVYFNKKLMVCGGYGSEYMNKCHQLHNSNSEWTEGPTMTTPRYYFSMTKAGQDLYALGGTKSDGHYLDSMEKLSESSGEWAMMDQKLTSPRYLHCTVFMETTSSLVTIGGRPSAKAKLVEEFSIATSSWKELAPLPVKLEAHGCAQLGQTIVVTGGVSGGGFSQGGTMQKKVYTFAGGQWETTGELQGVRYYHSMGTLDTKILILGGHTGVDFLDTIEEMQQDGSFQKTEWKLNEKRISSGITQVPRKMFPC